MFSVWDFFFVQVCIDFLVVLVLFMFVLFRYCMYAIPSFPFLGEKRPGNICNKAPGESLGHCHVDIKEVVRNINTDKLCTLARILGKAPMKCPLISYTRFAC